MEKENKKINQSQQKSQENPASEPEKRYNEDREVQPSRHAYDEGFRKLATMCSRLLLRFINKVFGFSFPEDTPVIPLQNEQVHLDVQGSPSNNRITDSVFLVRPKNDAERVFHIECQTRNDLDIVVRFFEYDSHIAFLNREISPKERNVIRIRMPHSAVLYLRYKGKKRKPLEIHVKAPNGQSLKYDVKTVFISDYSRERILEEGNMFLASFEIFNHVDNFKSYEKDEAKRKEFLDGLNNFISRMEALGNEVITPKELGIVSDVLLHVMSLLGKNFPKLSEGVRNVIMRQNFVTRTEKIFDEGKAEGRAEGEANGKIIGAIQILLEDGKSKDEIFARVAKKFHLEQERFEELFQKATENED